MFYVLIFTVWSKSSTCAEVQFFTAGRRYTKRGEAARAEKFDWQNLKVLQLCVFLILDTGNFESAVGARVLNIR